MNSKTSEETLETLKKLFRDLGIDFPGLNFVERDCVYRAQDATVHETDRTPVIFDPGLGGGTGEIPARCFNSGSLDLGGQGVTDNAGRFTWKLSSFVCKADRSSYLAPTSFVATAMSSAPVFLTTVTLSIGSDLVIDVLSWNPGGVSAPNVRFAWRSWVPTQPIIL